ncbi:MAG: DUF4136 domain-containing protein [Flavobacteriaceae bacterium]
MKKLSLGFLVVLITSCSSVAVFTDYDENLDFSTYNNYAYLKSEVDAAEISDLDKRRILRAVDSIMLQKGLTKSESPDLLIGFGASSEKDVQVSQWPNWWGFGWGWGWYGPGWGGNQTNISTRTVGNLSVRIYDARTQKLVWLGKGRGALPLKKAKRSERIYAFVTELMKDYPGSVQ